MEEKFQIETGDGEHTIYGTLNTPDEATDKLVVFVHGLTSHQNEHIFYNAVPRFVAEGFAVARFNLYSWEKAARRLRQTTIRLHAEDLEQVVVHFRDDYEKIGVVGHSFGGLTVLHADTDLFDALVLWDSTYLTKSWMSEAKYVKELNAYILDYGVESLIGPAMYEERVTSEVDPVTYAERVSKPMKVICAELGVVAEGGKKFHDAAKGDTEYVIIPGADHTFNAPGSEAKLHQETLAWMKRCLE